MEYEMGIKLDQINAKIDYLIEELEKAQNIQGGNEHGKSQSKRPPYESQR